MEIEKKSDGAFFGLIIIIAILIIGGIYIWKEKNKTLRENQEKIEAITEQNAAALKILEQDKNN